MQSSISWLLQKGILQKRGNKYLLTEKGNNIYDSVSNDQNNLFYTWKALELKIQEIT